MTQLLAVAYAAVAAVVTYLSVPAISRRSLRSPLGIPLLEEGQVLAAVWSDPRRLPFLAADLTEDMFASASHRQLWSVMCHAAGPLAHPEVPPGLRGRAAFTAADRAAAAAGAELAAAAQLWREQVQQAVSGPAAMALAAVRGIGEVDGFDLRSETADPAVVRAGSAVLCAGEERNKFSGSLRIVPTTHPESMDPQVPPLTRTWQVPSPARRGVVALIAAAAAAVIPVAGNLTGYIGMPLVAAHLSLLVLLATSVVVSYVDVDTMWVDIPVWAAGTAGSWLAATVAAYTGGELQRLAVGAALVAAVVVTFEIANFGYKLIRGTWGQGFGDNLIVVGTVGIPAALTGQLIAGYYSVMGGMLAAIAGWLLSRAAGRGGRDVPFAFGPFLYAGWVIAFIWLAALS